MNTKGTKDCGLNILGEKKKKPQTILNDPDYIHNEVRLNE